MPTISGYLNDDEYYSFLQYCKKKGLGKSYVVSTGALEYMEKHK